MTNEEKIRELARKHQGTMTDAQYLQLVYALEEMDQWKDEQFEKKLQEIVDYVYPRILGRERLHINEIIGKDMVWKHK